MARGSAVLPAMDLARATTEIISLHEFLVEWLRGSCAKDETLLTARFSTHFAPDLTFNDPTGKVLGAAELVNGFREEHGSAPNVEIEVRNVRAQLLTEDGGVFTYEEWQRNVAPADNGRLTTVVLRESATGPVWTHLQETMISP